MEETHGGSLIADATLKKDAIRRTAGAYVLYPGAQNQNWQGFHEIIPGLGAFAIRPSYDEDEGTSAGM